MNQNFDRAAAARGTGDQTAYSGSWATGGDNVARTALFNQRDPLRQPRTSPPFSDNISTANNSAGGRDCNRQSRPQQSANANTMSASRGSDDMDALVRSSNLLPSAPEFVPSGYIPYEDPVLRDHNQSYYGDLGLADMVVSFLDYLSSSPGSFESDIEDMTEMLNSYVTTEELLQNLVELIYTKSTAIPNFSYTGARLCNYLSKHLIVSPPSGNFRKLLLKRCQTEYEQRDKAVQGDPEIRKKFHSYVLFLGELYLHLEVKSGDRPPKRADILLCALKDLVMSLLSNPVDSNLICAVKLLKLTGSVLDDTWKVSGQPHMDELMQRIETILLDATCSRDVRQMLLSLVKLRSSDWGRVRSTPAASNATPDNDPNYFMNEPTFYTEDGTPFTAADPEYAEKYQEILERQGYFHDTDGRNRDEEYDYEDEMGPEIEDAFEKFCIETEKERQK